MKRLVFLALGLLVLGTFLYSQNRDVPRQNWGEGPAWGFAAEQLSLTGTLGLRQGSIVLESGDRIWYVPGLQRYTGFIEGPKAGATVTLEGWGARHPRSGENTGFLRVSKLTLNGTDYDLEGPGIARGAAPRWDRRSDPPRPAPYSYGPRDHRRPGPGRGRGCHAW
jgi:hypothetical protein